MYLVILNSYISLESKGDPWIEIVTFYQESCGRCRGVYAFGELVEEDLDVGICKYLVPYLDPKDDQISRVIFFLCEHNCLQALKKVAEKFDLTDVKPDPGLPLKYAILAENIDVVNYLMAAGVRLTSKTFATSASSENKIIREFLKKHDCLSIA